MTKIFETANEQHIRAGVVYFKSADGMLYHDAAKTTDNTVTKKELINLFEKGILVVDNGTGKVRPTLLTISTDYATVSHITVGAADIAVLASFNSAGYVAG
jgi:hypothetical protein